MADYVVDDGSADQQAVADSFQKYTEQLYAAYPGGAADAGFVSKEAFLQMHAQPVKSGWDGYQANKVQYQQKFSPHDSLQRSASREEIEAAAPFIRLVLERMLDLLDSEASWTKGKLAASASGGN